MVAKMKWQFIPIYYELIYWRVFPILKLQYINNLQQIRLIFLVDSNVKVLNGKIFVPLANFNISKLSVDYVSPYLIKNSNQSAISESWYNPVTLECNLYIFSHNEYHSKITTTWYEFKPFKLNIKSSRPQFKT